MSDTPFTKHPQLIELEDKIQLVSDLWGGTSAMKAAGTEYLPKEPAEETTNYSRRLERSVLFPAYKNSVIANTGRIFANDIEVLNANPVLELFINDINEDGDSLEKFMHNSTVSALHYGCSYILVDYPQIKETDTLADEVAMGAKPYFVLLEAPQILEASPIKVAGKTKLGVFRFREKIAFKKGNYEVGYVEQVKEFRVLGETVVYKIHQDIDGNIVETDNGVMTGMTDIPVVPLYANKVGFYLGSPTFIDLAYENVLNWQMTSDYNNIIHVSQVPMLFLKGAAQTYNDMGVAEEIAISPNTVISTDNPNADASWIEASGSASDSGRQAIQDSYQRMSQLSLEALTSPTGSNTATEALLDASESINTIKLIKHNVAEATQNAIAFLYKYMGVENPGTEIVFNKTMEEAIQEESNLPGQTSADE